MTANAAAVPGLVISPTTEYLTNNYRILKRHLNFRVDPPGSKQNYVDFGSLFLGIIIRFVHVWSFL